MNSEFTANTPEELASGIGPALCMRGKSKTVANERLQMTHLLKALAGTSVLRYPFRLRHTSEKVPDFQIMLGDRRVGVELTKIRFQDVEHGRALQERGVKETLSISGLFPKGDEARDRQTVIRDGFGMGQFVYPLPREEEDRIWLGLAKDRLDKKTAVLMRKDFAHGDEDWLVLVDSVGEIPEEVQGRRNAFSRVLAGYWRPGWFSRVFLQDNFYRWQIMFTPLESLVLKA